MKLKISELREGVGLINFWIVKTDSEGNVQKQKSKSGSLKRRRIEK
jgi:hypothetical protein